MTSAALKWIQLLKYASWKRRYVSGPHPKCISFFISLIFHLFRLSDPNIFCRIFFIGPIYVFIYFFLRIRWRFSITVQNGCKLATYITHATCWSDTNATFVFKMNVSIYRTNQSAYLNRDVGRITQCRVHVADFKVRFRHALYPMKC
jgi:hypothetical protein